LSSFKQHSLLAALFLLTSSSFQKPFESSSEPSVDPLFVHRLAFGVSNANYFISKLSQPTRISTVRVPPAASSYLFPPPVFGESYLALAHFTSSRYIIVVAPPLFDLFFLIETALAIDLFSILGSRELFCASIFFRSGTALPGMCPPQTPWAIFLVVFFVFFSRLPPLSPTVEESQRAADRLTHFTKMTLGSLNRVFVV